MFSLNFKSERFSSCQIPIQSFDYLTHFPQWVGDAMLLIDQLISMQGVTLQNILANTWESGLIVDVVVVDW